MSNMVGLATSCNPDKLSKVISECYRTMSLFHHITAEDKEDIVLMVMDRFERTAGRNHVLFYGRTYCRNKVVQLLRYRTAKKRMAQDEIDGKSQYKTDLSIYELVGRSESDKDIEAVELLLSEDCSFQVSEWVASVERVAPELLPVLFKALQGDRLTIKERKGLESVIKTF